jgi:flagella basal body P-ring formation protein FlgA
MIVTTVMKRTLWAASFPAFVIILLTLAPGVARAASPGVEDRVASALTDAVAERGPWERDQVMVSELSLPRDFAPAAGTRMSVELSGRERPVGRVSFRVVRTGPGGRQADWASARVDVMVPAVVAARAIGRHQVVDPSLLTTARVPLSQLPRGAAADADDLVGRRTVLRVARGRPFTRAMVEEPPVVLRGDRVTLMVRRPGLTVTAMGEAREDGAPDAVIAVTNLGSHRTVQARVVDARTVEVAY